MKKLTLTFGLIIATFTGFTQSESYKKVMTETVNKIENSFNASLINERNIMERVASAEPTEWLPSYWVAICYIKDSFLEKEISGKDQLLEKAEDYLKKTEMLAKSNDEVEVLKAYWAQAKLSADPMSRFQIYGEKFQKALAKAQEINPNNPRIPYLNGTSLFYTPEDFGGGKKVAKPLFEKAMDLYTKSAEVLTYAPHWGKAETNYFLEQCNL